MRQAVSAVLITYNEAEVIERCLRSIEWCDEVVVVDSGSTDGTVEICQRMGAKVIHRPFTNFGDQKRFAVAQASHSWVLSLDADEYLSASLQKEIQKELEAPRHHGYFLPRSLIFMGKKIRSEQRKPILRLFDKRYGNFVNISVHEYVKVQGSTGKLRGILWHESYRSLEDYFQKFNRYTSLMAQRIVEKGKVKPPTYAFLRFALGFLEQFFLKGCWLNGSIGMVWSLLTAYYSAVKYLKAYEISLQKSQ
jgi:glycosyltransferase involved in cell wall biosynthesis